MFKSNFNTSEATQVKKQIFYLRKECLSESQK